MKIPTITGIIERRILVNFRIEKEVITKFLPSPFEPVLHKDYGIGGICLIRFRDLRPKGMHKIVGISSENGAHRFAVKWNENGNIKEGVYIARRDSSSKINSLLGGRVFPGVHSYSEITSIENNGNYKVELVNSKDNLHLKVDADETDSLPDGSIFDDLESVSKFFENGSVGYSRKKISNEFEGLQLKAYNWRVIPMNVNSVESSFFNSEELFPNGSVAFDNALLMKNIEHEWSSEEDLK